MVFIFLRLSIRPNTMPNTISDADFNRIYWHSRRGMLELDLVLMPFVKTHFKELTGQQQQAYLQLLECEDQDMFGWFVKRKTPEDKVIAAIVTLILDRHSDIGSKSK